MKSSLFRLIIFRLIIGAAAVFFPLASGGCQFGKSTQPVLRVSGPAADGSEAARRGPVGAAAADLYDSTIGDFFSGGLYNAVLVGRFLDAAPAERLARTLKSRGLTAFVLKRTVAEKDSLAHSAIGDFYLTMAGLFGRRSEAEILGRRLQAEGRIRDYRVVPVNDGGEIERSAAASAAQAAQAAQNAAAYRAAAARPLPADSPAASGEAFKRNVYGRYVGSFRDPLAAQAEAEALTAGGWPASVTADRSGGRIWHRVYLAAAGERRDWKAEPAELARARRSAASPPGLVILADMSSLAGHVGVIAPNASRTDASACAGFSEAGRVEAVLRRAVNYIPDTSYTAALIPVDRQPIESWRDMPSRIKNWWDGEGTMARTKALYGPAIFNRPDMEAAIGRLKADEAKASLAMGLTLASRELAAIPGRKALLVFSEFMGNDRPEEVKMALEGLRAEFGSLLEVLFIYGDADADGYALAADLAGTAGGRPWDSCLLLANNAYFESFIKTVFR
ncbi:MAG: hypothetical protein LBS31_05625 [Candidatus Adiutrix sp.]|jgi:hypothetical protein|nr:hypothetical protein [Candidatus Adiutrix sp.]